MMTNLPLFSGVGPRNGLTLILDTHAHSSLYKNVRKVKEQSEPDLKHSFSLALDATDSFPLPNFGGMKIEPGKRIRLVFFTEN